MWWKIKCTPPSPALLGWAGCIIKSCIWHLWFQQHIATFQATIKKWVLNITSWFHLKYLFSPYLFVSFKTNCKSSSFANKVNMLMWTISLYWIIYRPGLTFVLGHFFQKKKIEMSWLVNKLRQCNLIDCKSVDLLSYGAPYVVYTYQNKVDHKASCQKVFRMISSAPDLKH